MHGYTHDAESIDLTPDEHAAFAHLVRYSCDLPEQHKISCFLALTVRPQNRSVCDFLARQVLAMWCTEVKL